MEDLEIKDDKYLIYWMLFSLVSAAVFAKATKGMCSFLFLSFSWIFVWTLFSQSWTTMERKPKEIGLIAVASLVGWIIGTFIVWKGRGLRRGFFEN